MTKLTRLFALVIKHDLKKVDAISLDNTIIFG